MNASSQGTYIEAIESSCARYPDLVKLSRYLSRPRPFPGRAAVLEFGAGSVKRLDFQNADSLKLYFFRTTRAACKYRLYLLEDLSRPFVEAFGAHFWMDPFLFAAHENSTHWTGTRHDYALPRRLPSLKKADPSFTMRYYEVVKGLGGNVEKEDWRTLSNVERKINKGDLNHDFDGQQYPDSVTYFVRRNASFWSRGRKGGGWDALILIDPPIGQLILTGKSTRRWPNKPYGSGYIDFSPWNGENVRSALQNPFHGPPRQSTLDDVAYYWMNVATAEQIAEVQNDVAMSPIFLKKIVASNWNVLLEFVWAKLGDFERKLGDMEGTKLHDLGEILADVSLFRRRLSWYYDQVEMSLRSVGIALDAQSSNEGNELLSILSRLQGYKDKVESLTPIVTGMINVRQADISLKETRLVSKLTLVALVFIPLSFTASIFSMGGDFQPGSSSFWVYFAVALPFTLIILALAWWLRGKSLI